MSNSSIPERDIPETIIPASFIFKNLKATPSSNITKGGCLYLAGVLEYVIAEILVTAISQSTDSRRKVTPDTILAAIIKDPDLSMVFPAVGKSHYKNMDFEKMIEKRRQAQTQKYGILFRAFGESNVERYLSYLRGPTGLSRKTKAAVTAFCIQMKRAASFAQGQLM